MKKPEGSLLKLWLLTPVKPPTWDGVLGVVVCASGGSKARTLVPLGYDEQQTSKDFWKKAEFSSCKLIGFATPSQVEGVVLTSTK